MCPCVAAGAGFAPLSDWRTKIARPQKQKRARAKAPRSRSFVFSCVYCTIGNVDPSIRFNNPPGLPSYGTTSRHVIGVHVIMQ